MPRQIAHTAHRLPFGSDPNPVQFGFVPAVAADVPAHIVNGMSNSDRLMVSAPVSAFDQEAARRHYRYDIPFSKPYDRRVIPAARGPVRPLEWGAQRRKTEERGLFPSVPRHIGGRHVEFK
jgi:hypothetical protein